MPMYSYTVKDSKGKTKTDIVESINEQSLIEKLQSEGYFIISVKTALRSSAKAKKVAANKKFSHDKVKTEDLLVFSRQLATMLEAGVTLLRSLDVIHSQIQSKQLSDVVREIRNDIEQGKSLSAALSKHPKIFNQFWVSLAEVGEASGTMPKVLNKLAEHVEQEAAFRSTITSAMVYPAILFFVCIGAVLFFALVVAPQFEQIFNSLHSDLPVMTRGLLSTFRFIKGNFLMLVGGIAAVIFLFKAYIKTASGRLQYEKFLFQLPIVGDVVRTIIVERFSSQMAILVDSGVPILYALEITEKMVENDTCSLVIAQVRASVREGKGLADALLEQDFFPMMSVQMIKVGEETGELSKMLNHVGVFYKNNVQAFVKRFGTMIEPFMLVFMAGIIGVIVVSIFLPLFNLGQGARH